jgi:hypothetical protein
VKSKSSIREVNSAGTKYWWYCPLFGKYCLGVMSKKPAAGLDSLLFPSPVLITESKTDFDELHAALTQELAPHGVVEKIFVADIANLVWELRRLRRSKTATWNMASK